MLRIALILVVLYLFMASPAIGQTGVIGVYADNAGFVCDLRDEASGSIDFHVVHTNTNGATAAVFSARKPVCMSDAVWLTDIVPELFSTVGNSQAGIGVGYSACLSGPILLVTMRFFSPGTTPPCSCYDILPHPEAASGEIEVKDCAFKTRFTTGIQGVVNSDASCPPCVAGAKSCSRCSVPIEESTWGQVKSLFGE